MCTYASPFVRVVCVHVFLCLCVRVCVRVCMCARMSIFLRVFAFVRVVCVHAFVCACMRMCVRVYVFVCEFACCICLCNSHNVCITRFIVDPMSRL